MRSRENLVQPDLFVVAAEDVSNDWSTFRTLLLAVEVLSETSAQTDRIRKRRLYQRQRVGTYWIVDHDAGLVEVWTPEDERPTIATEQVTWRVAPDGRELVIDLAQVFAGPPPTRPC